MVAPWKQSRSGYPDGERAMVQTTALTANRQSIACSTAHDGGEKMSGGGANVLCAAQCIGGIVEGRLERRSTKQCSLAGRAIQP